MDSNDIGTEDEPLTFTNHNRVLHGRFAEMFHNVELTDVTLGCKNKMVQAHRFVLSATSSFFNKKLKELGTGSQLSINCVTHKELMNILNCIYNGEIKQKSDDKSTFLNAAKQLCFEVKGNQDLIQQEFDESDDDNSQYDTDTGSDDNTIFINVHGNVKAQVTDQIMQQFGREEFFEKMFIAQNLEWQMKDYDHSVTLKPTENVNHVKILNGLKSKERMMSETHSNVKMVTESNIKQMIKSEEKELKRKIYTRMFSRAAKKRLKNLKISANQILKLPDETENVKKAKSKKRNKNKPNKV